MDPSLLYVAESSPSSPTAPFVRSTTDAVLAARPVVEQAPDQESVVLITLGPLCRVISVELVHRGSARNSLFDVPTILRRVLIANAARFIVVHNHPSGDTSPSQEDDEVTRKLKDAADVVGLDLLDHIVIGGCGWTSYAQLGRLERT